MTKERNNRRNGIAIGLSAGLIGGTAAGLAFGVPSLSAASGEEPAGLVAIAHVSDADGPAASGERLRAALDDLVVDGTISGEQADAVTDHLMEGRAERVGNRRQNRSERSEALTELLGVDAETIRTELRGGATLAEVAEANGVSADAVVDVLVAQAMERIDLAVEAGRIDESTADEKAAELEDRIAERVSTPRGER